MADNYPSLAKRGVGRFYETYVLFIMDSLVIANLLPIRHLVRNFFHQIISKTPNFTLRTQNKDPLTYLMVMIFWI